MDIDVQTTSNERAGPNFWLTSRWLNCQENRAVISGSNPRAVLLNDSVYMNGSRSKNNKNIWKYSVSKNTLTPISYPPCALAALTNEQTITAYQSQLLWIGKCDKSSDSLSIFTLVDEETHSWKEVMPSNFPEEMLQHIPALPWSISSASEGSYLIVVLSGPQVLLLLVFDGQEWRQRDGPDCTAPAHGRIDAIIHDGTIFLTTYMGFYKTSLEAILAANNPQWKTLTKISKESHSNLTLFHDRIMVLTPSNFNDRYVHIILLAYESVSDTWLIMEKFECHISWIIPSVVGLPDGRLLIFGVIPGPQQIPYFDILEVTIKGNIQCNCF